MTTILALDQGTTSTKAALVTAAGEVAASASVPVRRTYPRPGWVEQDATELWQSALAAMGQLSADGVSAIALTNQRESILVWDRATGRPLAPCISWQCARGAELCAELRASGAEPFVREATGLPLDPMFSASKLHRLLDGDARIRAAAESGSACVGTVDSWLLWNLSGGAVHATDAGNAARTHLYDIHRLEWSDELLELFSLPRAFLPAVVESAGVVAESMPLSGFPSLPIAAVAADSHAALYGLGCLEPGTAKATFGTGTSLMSATAQEVRHSHSGLASTVAWLRAVPTYALEGNVYSTGATVSWVADLLGLASPDDVERLARTVPDSGGIHLVPAFAGLGAPHWQPRARARVTGLTFATGRAELARAALESTAFQVADLVEALAADVERPLSELRVDGGASRNDALMQLQADMLGLPVARAHASDAAAVGVALLAAGAVDVERNWTRFEPRLGDAARAELLARWRAAVAETAPVGEAALS